MHILAVIWLVTHYADFICICMYPLQCCVGEVADVVRRTHIRNAFLLHPSIMHILAFVRDSLGINFISSLYGNMVLIFSIFLQISFFQFVHVLTIVHLLFYLFPHSVWRFFSY
jgi:hypothetical protein